MKNNNYHIIIIATLLSGLCCRQTYNPPNLKGITNYLVVDGIIINGQDSTIINLSRAQNINDSSSYTIKPETNATVNVVGTNGDSYILAEQSAGKYVVPQLNLNLNEQYRLKITTSNGSQYQSDTLSVKITPPIDSVNWQLQNDGVHIFVNTHDPQNNTRYYRWQYTETWQYNSAYESELIYQNGQIISRDTNQLIYTCWKNNQSTNLLLGSSAKLASDLIYMQPLVVIPLASQQIGIEYSILVKQYAINAAAYNFWQLLQQNTELLGSLFDAQPSQLTGNIHNISNPAEPVLGYITASSLQQQRIFINNFQILSWGYLGQSLNCTQILVKPNSSDMSFYFGAGYLPILAVYTSSGGFAGYSAALSPCVDCTLQGGTTFKPSYWP